MRFLNNLRESFKLKRINTLLSSHGAGVANGRFFLNRLKK